MEHFHLLFCIFAVATGAYGWGSLDKNPCNIYPEYAEPGIPKDPNNVIEDRVPADCYKGKVEWHYPWGHLMLHFPKRDRTPIQICVQDWSTSKWDKTGITDVTAGDRPLDQVMKDNYICTTKHHSTDIVLKLDAHESNRYLVQFNYRVQRQP